MTNHFLMCEPQYFDVSYVINPWMTGNIHRVGRSQAKEQWTNLHALVGNAAGVELIRPEPDLPDMPFTANAGLVVGDRVILSNFRHPERQGEEAHFERWFDSHGFTVRRLPRDLFFEGAGDALLDRERDLVWVGYGHRSDRAAGAHIQYLLNLNVVSLELVDARFYHLDTCLCPLRRGYVLYYPGAFSAESQAVLQKMIGPEKALVVSEADAITFACNAVNIGDQVIVNRASDALRQSLTQAGFQVTETALSEFLRAGGASKCLVLRLEEAA